MKQTYTLSRQIQEAMSYNTPEQKEKLDKMMNAAMTRIISTMENHWLYGTGSGEQPKGITYDEMMRHSLDISHQLNLKRNAFYLEQQARLKAPKPIIYFDGI